MEDKIKLKLEYKKLIRNGKKTEAQKILKKIWANKDTSVKTEPKADIVINKEAKKKVSNITSLSDLSTISGIGKKTVKDIMTMFSDLDSLIIAIKNDKVALRDDIVDSLKLEFL